MKKSLPLLATSLLLLGVSATPVLSQDKQAGMMGEHEMSGMVQKIDHKKGTFELKTHETTLHLHFPPNTLKDVKNGDGLTVQLGFKMGSPVPMKMK